MLYRALRELAGAAWPDLRSFETVMCCFLLTVLQLHAERERERQRRAMVNQGADGGNQWRRDASGRDPLGRLPQLEP